MQFIKKTYSQLLYVSETITKSENMLWKLTREALASRPEAADEGSKVLLLILITYHFCM